MRLTLVFGEWASGNASTAQAITLNWVSSTAVLAHLRTIARERLVDLLYAPTTDKRAPQWCSCYFAWIYAPRTTKLIISDRSTVGFGEAPTKQFSKRWWRTELAATCSIAALGLRIDPHRIEQTTSTRSVGFLAQSNR